MATWNNRIIDHGDHLALHEVHYDDQGNVTGWTANPVTFVVDAEEGAVGLCEALKLALNNARKSRPLDVRTLPGGNGPTT